MILTCFPFFLAVDALRAVEVQLVKIRFELDCACDEPNNPDRISLAETLRGMMGRLPEKASDANADALQGLKARISVYLQRLTARKQIFILHLPTESDLVLIFVYVIRYKLAPISTDVACVCT